MPATSADTFNPAAQPSPTRHAQLRTRQLAETGTLAEREHRHQTGHRHQAGIVELRTAHRSDMR